MCVERVRYVERVRASRARVRAIIASSNALQPSRWIIRMPRCWSRQMRVGTRWLKYEIERASTENGISNWFRRRRSTATVSRTLVAQVRL